MYVYVKNKYLSAIMKIVYCTDCIFYNICYKFYSFIKFLPIIKCKIRSIDNALRSNSHIKSVIRLYHKMKIS